MSLTIVNRSQWPNWFVKPVCNWIVRRAGIDWDYQITLPSYANTKDLCGRGWRQGQRSRINRRIQPPGGWPWYRPYYPYTWSAKREMRNRVEAFVHLIAHEAWHAIDHHPDRQTDEMNAERFGDECVEAFREWWPVARARIMAGLRADRQRRVLAKIGPTPDDKMAKAESMLAAWERKRDAAERRCAKYRRKIRALRAAQTRRAANPPAAKR
ncbi:MAG: hypothetical protein IT438_16370 [Phycisphaerales bacterium]|nr:hypothetical protein [Phycisphaerales bacterium]